MDTTQSIVVGRPRCYCFRISGASLLVRLPWDEGVGPERCYQGI